MAIELATKYAPYVDEVFTEQSKLDLVTTNSFEFGEDAETVKIYKIGTAPMNDYGRRGPSGSNWSRYGEVEDLAAETESYKLSNDRSFTFVIDTLDKNETVMQLEASKALARQLREVVIPEVDKNLYEVMAFRAGTKLELTEDEIDLETKIYDYIIDASEALDSAKIPDTPRTLIVPPKTYRMMKKSKEIIMATETGAAERKKGIIGFLDGCTVVKVSAELLPEGCIFIMAYKNATIAPTKLANYKVHRDPPGISGDLVEGRIVYDAFVFDNRQKGIYYLGKKADEA